MEQFIGLGLIGSSIMLLLSLVVTAGPPFLWFTLVCGLGLIGSLVNK